ncbi:similar to Saccharomyces cerevisiae YEL060C PRB1 Vacuolar proteinase B (yscB), a serine protease of the subtilisin family [Maudiozyma barnettii]|uniref:Similar to Saccharomyces cerevisiae YEL060C PRB1 Vacuolar proteinase B (YscB), a serine protease of the subtilisin family n=1 Tax=Maudiozyma barnettii TaxID=61262 RepID=A0A8H2VHS9_9SACH|nr:proteinase B [Kazachstania barnettii]CAB4255568.1 similar to Saccharomyces cerevisiae YEL060C PRB1 Vacuolar proteinase B (yscB), a serine protease of the subtilisin family [Kazachstania barnettii]CAD1784066.1 similar to Saccharomyces cerevisiae YEL060C PRB1 Vacuolar proteinase B (yscB), a serine protease of the subtilisin family [Kazachstania barnettii]
MKVNNLLLLLSLLSQDAVRALVLPELFQEQFPALLSALSDSITPHLKEQDGSAHAAAVAASAHAASAKEEKEMAPLYVPSNPGTHPAIKDKYIIVFKDSITPQQIQFHLENIQQAVIQELAITTESIVDHDFATFDIGSLLSGYTAVLPPVILDLVRNNPLVAFVEQDSMVYATDFNTENNAPWGLARISHRESLNLANFNKYLYDDKAGEGVDAYVIDTGININHNEFEGRATWGKTIPLNDEDVDGNGHGTHCAGTIASKKYGVAKHANLFAIKVLRSNGSGSMSDVLKGVEYAAKMHTERKAKDKNFKGSTANMSLGGGKSPSLDLAVNAAVKAGLHFAVAAGNENQDACNTSPASAENAITVGASTLSDDRAYFSNWGKCVDIFAPGLNILSTYIGDSNDVTATLSGTSMASPHVAGLLTYFLSLQPEKSSSFYSQQTITPEQLKQKLIDYSTKNILNDISADTPNKLIYNGAGGDLSGFWNN